MHLCTVKVTSWHSAIHCNCCCIQSYPIQASSLLPIIRVCKNHVTWKQSIISVKDSLVSSPGMQQCVGTVKNSLCSRVHFVFQCITVLWRGWELWRCNDIKHSAVTQLTIAINSTGKIGSVLSSSKAHNITPIRIILNSSFSPIQVEFSFICSCKFLSLFCYRGIQLMFRLWWWLWTLPMVSLISDCNVSICQFHATVSKSSDPSEKYHWYRRDVSLFNHPLRAYFLKASHAHELIRTSFTPTQTPLPAACCHG